MPDIYIIQTWHKYHSCPIPISFIPDTCTRIHHARCLYHSYLALWFAFHWSLFLECCLFQIEPMKKNTKCVQKISACIDQPVVRIHVKELTRNKTSYVMRLLISDLKSVVIYLTRSICVCLKCVLILQIPALFPNT